MGLRFLPLNPLNYTYPKRIIASKNNNRWKCICSVNFKRSHWAKKCAGVSQARWTRESLAEYMTLLLCFVPGILYVGWNPMAASVRHCLPVILFLHSANTLQDAAGHLTDAGQKGSRAGPCFFIRSHITFAVLEPHIHNHMIMGMPSSEILNSLHRC